jgi:hypothetical protein
VEAKAKSRGTGAANLWHLWKSYKNVAHLVTAATLICGEARTKACNEPFGPFGLSIDQFGPFQMAMLMPDLVLAAALEFEQRGLGHVAHARTEPALDPETLWRTPPDINVASLSPPTRATTHAEFDPAGAVRVVNPRTSFSRSAPLHGV